MQNSRPISCLTCKIPFTQYNLPHQLINCEHVVCKRCVVTQKECGGCGTGIGLDQHSLRNFTAVCLEEYRKKCELNAVKDENLTKNQQKMEECLLHSKPADLICLDDCTIICSSCALFGKHKGHEVINREGLLFKFTNFLEECLKVYDIFKQNLNIFNSKVYEKDMHSMLNEQKQKNKKKVTQKIQNAISILRVIEKKEHLKLNEFYKQKEKRYEQKYERLETLETEINNWCSQIQSIGSLIEDTSDLEKISQCVPYINDKSNFGNEIIQNGQILLQNFEETHQAYANQLLKQRDVEVVQFDEEKLKTLSQYCTIKRQIKHKITQSILTSDDKQNASPSKQKIQWSGKGNQISKNYEVSTNSFNETNKVDARCLNFDEDNLLLSVSPSLQLNEHLSSLPTIPQIHMVAEELNIESLSYLCISDIRPIANMNSGQSSDQSRFSYKDRQLKEIANAGISIMVPSDNQKKKKKIDFPEKFKGVVEDLKNDRAQTIDLTGAQAGDGSVLSLCPYIKKSKKLKVLKLIKNKLSDECLCQLLESLVDTKVNSLNLSQNLFTDKAASIIHGSFINQHLKTITLSLNKINKRGVKNKIDELGKRNITVLL